MDAIKDFVVNLYAVDEVQYIIDAGSNSKFRAAFII